MLRPKKYFDVARMVQNQAAHHYRADRQHEAAVGGSTFMRASEPSVTTILLHTSREAHFGCCGFCGCEPSFICPEFLRKTTVFQMSSSERTPSQPGMAV